MSMSWEAVVLCGSEAENKQTPRMLEDAGSRRHGRPTGLSALKMKDQFLASSAAPPDLHEERKTESTLDDGSTFHPQGREGLQSRMCLRTSSFRVGQCRGPSWGTSTQDMG